MNTEECLVSIMEKVVVAKLSYIGKLFTFDCETGGQRYCEVGKDLELILRNIWDQLYNPSPPMGDIKLD